MERNPSRSWNPYAGGVALGLVLLATFLLMGKGLGASGATYRPGVWALDGVAPAHAQSVPAIAGASQAIVSQQLRIRSPGLVAATREDGFARYRLAEPALVDLVCCMERCER